MAINAENIMAEAALVLQDPTPGVRWQDAELLGWLNRAQEQVVIEKPDANATIANIALAAGSVQDIPAGSIQLLGVTTNMGTDGSTRGNIVSVVESKYMDAIDPGWMIATADNTVIHVIYDVKRAPKKFWVYPQSTGNNYIEVIHAPLPAEVAAKANPIKLADEYRGAIMHYMLFMAFSKDAEGGAPYTDRAVAHFNAFITALGLRDERERRIHPKKTSLED